MTLLEFLSQIPDAANFSRKSKIKLIAYYLRKYRGIAEFAASEIKRYSQEALLRTPSNLSTLLKELSSGRGSPLITGTQRGRYSLSLDGLTEIEELLAQIPASRWSYNEFLATAVPYLRRIVSNVGDENRRTFLAEAISCLGVEARRATIVMTWIATIDHLYDHILAYKLADFNSALARRSDGVSSLRIASKDDFENIRESVFIEVCRSARIITNGVRKILDEKLGIRNSAAHPSTITIHDSKVVNFIEDLVDNVVVKYPM